MTALPEPQFRPEPQFYIEGARVLRSAASPHLAFDVRIEQAGGVIHNILLHCQVQIEPVQRPYGAAERERLRDLFGETGLWGRTLK